MLVFHGSSTLLRSFRARSVNLSILFLGSLQVSSVHILLPVTDNSPFLNQRKGDNGRRKFFMTILLPRRCVGREDGICDRPHTRRTCVRPSYYARQRNLKEEVVHAAERLALPRSMSSVRYSLEAIFKSITQTVSHCTESCIIIQQSSWSDWNTIGRSFKSLNNLMSKGCPPWAKKKKSARFAFLSLQK